MKDEKKSAEGETPEPAQAQEPQKDEPISAPPASETDEEFDKPRALETIHKLREIEKQYKRDQKELETLRAEKKQREEAEMTESDRLKAQAAEARARAAQLEAELLRREVIDEVDLPPIFAARLKGSTKEELLADAEELKKALPPIPKTTPPRNPAINPANADKSETDAQKRERLFGPQRTNIFDMDAIREGGGGVVWPNPNKE